MREIAEVSREVNEMSFKSDGNVKQEVLACIIKIAGWFLTALFIWWGWDIFAWNFNLPQFTYIEVFAMRMALSCIVRIFWQKQ